MRSAAIARPHTILTGTLEKWLKRETPLPTPARQSGNRFVATQHNPDLPNERGRDWLPSICTGQVRRHGSKQAGSEIGARCQMGGQTGPVFMTLRQTEGRFVAPAPRCCRSSVVNDPAAGSPQNPATYAGAWLRSHRRKAQKKERERRKDRQVMRRSQPGRLRRGEVSA